MQTNISNFAQTTHEKIFTTMTPSCMSHGVTCNSLWRHNCFLMPTLHTTMTIKNRLKITLTPLRLHSASSLRIPNSINNFRTLIPALRLRPLNLLSASSVNLHGLANTSIFRKNLRVMFSRLNHQFYVSTLIHSKDLECILVFRSAMPRGVTVVCIYVSVLPSLHLWMVGNFQLLIILIWTENR